MKLRQIFASCTVLSLFLSASAFALDTSGWYQYNGQSEKHNFSFKFPKTWQVQTIGDDLQGFLPAGSDSEDLLLEVQEFQGQTYNQVTSYFRDEETSFLRSEDFILKTNYEEILGKKIYYLDKAENREFYKILVKRGSLILSIGRNSRQYAEIVDGIEKTLNFEDDWHQYIDLKSKYAFLFPKSLKINHLSNGVELLNDKNETIFSVFQYKNTDISGAIDKEEGDTKVALSQEDSFFHVGSATKIVKFRDKKSGRAFSRIFVQKDGNVYSLSNLNVIDNFPVSNYYKDSILEMLSSFEFFSAEFDEGYSPYIHFPDVRDKHPNSQAINALVTDKVINGYPDGNFKPNGQINRAELTKMIVATQTSPKLGKYSNCFPDVKEQWFAPHICYAKFKGWVDGYPDGNFRPENPINRVEAMKIVFEVIFGDELSAKKLTGQKPEDVDLNAWYKDYMIFALNNDLLDKQHIIKSESSYSYFPGENISRKEVAEMIYRSQKR